MSETLFDVSIIGETYTHTIRNTTITIVIRRENNGVASIQFVSDENLIPMNIPDGIRLYSNKRVLEYQVNETTYAVCPTDKYWIEYNGDIVLTFNPIRAWRITPE